MRMPKQKLKLKLHNYVQTPSGIAQIVLDSVAIKDLAKFLQKCHSIRFLEDDAKEPAAKVPLNAPVAQTQ